MTNSQYDFQIPESGRPYEIELNENRWLQVSNRAVTREMLMMTLSEVQWISVRGNINRDTTKMSLYGINYDRAVEGRTSHSGSPIPTVEQCVCPVGYKGRIEILKSSLNQTVGSSCEQCASGYYRAAGLYLGLCKKCDCNGHSTSCKKDGTCLVNFNDFSQFLGIPFRAVETIDQDQSVTLAAMGIINYQVVTVSESQRFLASQTTSRNCALRLSMQCF